MTATRIPTKVLETCIRAIAPNCIVRRKKSQVLVETPKKTKLIAVHNAMASSLGSRNIVAINGLHAATTTATVTPIPVLNQNRLLIWLGVILLLCTVASPRPKSINHGVKLVRL